MPTTSQRIVDRRLSGRLPSCRAICFTYNSCLSHASSPASALFSMNDNTLDQFSHYWELLLLSGFSEAPASVTPMDEQICRWSTEHGICSSILPQDPKVPGLHFRCEHAIRGREKDTVVCLWNNCQAAPMQRGSIIRHILAVYMRILQWVGIENQNV
ncbi:hypothetical protein BU15DRAFT_66276 [Melanogaster broomeanus]|nr:hypothetical protein BU15DRAFT_66276 [Melanogaster broomeanus]